MPDEKGKLSQEEADKIIAEINKRLDGKKLKCEVCNTSDWSAQDLITTPVSLGAGGRVNVVGSIGAFPDFRLICRKCTNTKIFNLVMLGLYD